MDADRFFGAATGVLVFLLIAGGVTGTCAFYPRYRVWQQHLAGEAELRRAEYSKKILVEQAKAEKESATLHAEAEVIRAGGIAKSNELIAGGLRGNRDYLQYLAIQAQMKMADSPNHTTVYIPSGTNGIPLIYNLNDQANLNEKAMK